MVAAGVGVVVASLAVASLAVPLAHEMFQNTIIGRVVELAIAAGMGGYHYANGSDFVGTALATGIGYAGTWHWGARGLAAVDEMGKTALYEAAKTARAIRDTADIVSPTARKAKFHELMNETPYAVKHEAELIANEFTLNAAPGPRMQSIIEALRQRDPRLGFLPKAYRVGLTVAVPFVNIINNSLKFAGRRTPGLDLLHAGLWNDLKNGSQMASDTAKAQLAVAAGVALVIANAASKGVFRGAGPADPNEFRDWVSDGNQPYSMNIGEWSMGLNRADPYGQITSIIADWTAIAEHASAAENDQIAMALVLAISKDVMSKTYFENSAEVLEAITDTNPNKKYRFLQQLVPSLTTPSIVRQWREIQDPHLREVRGMLDAIINRIPGASKELSPKKNVFADPSMYYEPTHWAADWISPFPIKKKRNDPAIKALLENGISAPGVPWAIYGSADKQWSMDAGRESAGIPLTHKLHDELVDLVGKQLKEEWLDFVNSPDYDPKNLGPDSNNAFVFRQIYGVARKAGIKQLVDNHPELETDLETVLERRGLAREAPQGPRPSLSTTEEANRGVSRGFRRLGP